VNSFSRGCHTHGLEIKVLCIACSSKPLCKVCVQDHIEEHDGMVQFLTIKQAKADYRKKLLSSLDICKELQSSVNKGVKSREHLLEILEDFENGLIQKIKGYFEGLKNDFIQIHTLNTLKERQELVQTSLHSLESAVAEIDTNSITNENFERFRKLIEDTPVIETMKQDISKKKLATCGIFFSQYELDLVIKKSLKTIIKKHSVQVKDRTKMNSLNHGNIKIEFHEDGVIVEGNKSGKHTAGFKQETEAKHNLEPLEKEFTQNKKLKLNCSLEGHRKLEIHDEKEMVLDVTVPLDHSDTTDIL